MSCRSRSCPVRPRLHRARRDRRGGSATRSTSRKRRDRQRAKSRTPWPPSSRSALGRFGPGAGAKAVHVWSLVEITVIAAVRGAALGGGLQIAWALTCAWSAPMEAGDGDELGHHPRYVRHITAATTRRSSTSEEAHRHRRHDRRRFIGLVEKVVEDDRSRPELAGQITRKSRSSLVWAKRCDLSRIRSQRRVRRRTGGVGSAAGHRRAKQVVAERLAMMKAARSELRNRGWRNSDGRDR